MSNIFKSANLDADFNSFFQELPNTNRFKYPINESYKSLLKKYHRIVYSIALLLKKIEAQSRNEHNKYAYLLEILSDLLINSTLPFLGYKNTSLMVMRRVVENFYNHIYFFDHHIEFNLLNAGRNEYQPMTDLKNYLEAHPIINSQIKKDKRTTECNTNLFNYYQELCRVVHSKGLEFMGLANNLEKTKQDFDIKEHFENAQKQLTNIIYLLYKFHDTVTFTNIEKDLIAKNFPRDLRTTLFA